MLKQLGKMGRLGPGVTPLFRDCHAKIRHFIGLARAAGEAAATAEEIADACAQAARYFAEALPLHVADEEESLLPRLRGREPALDVALTTMHDEHVEHDRHDAGALLASLRALQSAPTDSVLRSELSVIARRCEASLTRHLEQEERIIFPAIERLLSVSEQDAILLELRARRAR